MSSIIYFSDSVARLLSATVMTPYNGLNYSFSFEDQLTDNDTMTNNRLFSGSCAAN